MIRNTFPLDRAFNRQQFSLFLREFLPDDFTPANRSLSLPFQPKYVTGGELLGTCRSLELEVFLVSHTSAHDARVGISKELFRMLCANSMYNRALVVTIPEGASNWRLSLLQMEISQDDNSARVRYEYSNPRRHSFMLGECAKIKTPEKFLFEMGEVHERTENRKQLTEWEDLESRFSVESLTKEFYDRLYHWYQWAVEAKTEDAPGVTFPNNPETTDDDKDNMNVKIIRLITRLLFVWFIKQKDLVPNDIFDYKDRLNDILREFDYNSHTQGNYYNAILQNLFFATLNNEIDRRSFTKPAYMGASSSYGVKSVYRDSTKASWFKISHDEVLELFKTVPYMNCGLFECLDKVAKSDINTPVDMLLDGFSSRDAKQKDPKTGKDNYKYRAFIPNELFFGEERIVKVMVEEKKGKQTITVPKPVKVEGIIRLFEEYNFTVEENTPSDVQVSLDPELLGRVFENLLAAYNPETKENARKSTGSFYTPRPIVEYMVNESLVQYLKTKVVGGEQLEPQLRKLISYKDEEVDIPEVQRRDILHCIYTCKVLDPACGSGAFPMGMLQQMVHIMRRIDPENTIWHDVVLEEATRETMNALKNEKDKEVRHQRMQEIEEEFEDDLTNADYKRKLYLIRNCIYGVDIQPIAMLISKLRFFISLVCEQNPDMNAPEKNYGINTLPNLETKFVAANTLIPASIRNYKEGLFSDTQLAKLKDELLEIRMRHFQVKTQRSKQANRERDGKKRDEIKDYILNTAAKIDTDLIERNKALIAKYEEEIKDYMTPEYEERIIPVAGNLFEPTQMKMVTVDKNKIKRDDINSCINVCKREIAREENKRNLPEFEAAVREVTQWNPYDQVNASPFFDPEWMFGVEGGFDIVIGNPPYISAPAQIANPELNAQRELLKNLKIGNDKLYKSLNEKWDLYIPFIEKGLQVLNLNGVEAMIVPYPLSNQKYSKVMRMMLCEDYCLKTIVDLNGVKVFENVTVTNCIPIVQKAEPADIIPISRINSNKEIKVVFTKDLDKLVTDEETYVWHMTEEHWDNTRHQNLNVLGDFCYVSKGMVINSDEKTSKGEFSRDDLICDFMDDIHCREYIEAKDMSKYIVERVHYLEYNTERSPSRFSRPTFPELYEREKLLINRLGNLNVAIDSTKHYLHNDSIFCAVPWHLLHDVENKSITSSITKNCNLSRYEMEKLSKRVETKYLLGVLNSKYAEVLLTNVRAGDYHIYPDHIRKIPVPMMDNVYAPKIVSMVDVALEAKQADSNADISSTEKNIDMLVYKLYELSYEEVVKVDSSIIQSEYESFNPDEL